MRRALFAASFAIAVGVTMLPATPASAASDPFRGSWTSVDPFDGSTQYLSINGSGKAGNHSVFLFDTVATGACSGGPANVTGPGQVDDDTLYWVFTVTCPGGGRGPVTGLSGPGFFVYDSGTDTLTDDAEALWSRL